MKTLSLYIHIRLHVAVNCRPCRERHFTYNTLWLKIKNFRSIKICRKFNRRKSRDILYNFMHSCGELGVLWSMGIRGNCVASAQQ